MRGATARNAAQTHTLLLRGYTMWFCTQVIHCDLTGCEHRSFTLLWTKLDSCITLWCCESLSVCVLSVPHLHRPQCPVGLWSDSVSTSSSFLLWRLTPGRTKPERDRDKGNKDMEIFYHGARLQQTTYWQLLVWLDYCYTIQIHRYCDYKAKAIFCEVSLTLAWSFIFEQ